MKPIRFFFVMLWAVAAWLLPACSIVGQTDEADYLWMVDVSGGRNIYIEGIQDAIDTFYVETMRHDRLHTFNFAKSVVDAGQAFDADFYDYCDLTAMLTALDSLIGHSRCRYVRAFVLSDFHNADSLHGSAVLESDSLRWLGRSMAAHIEGRDVKVYLMVLPPSGRYDGYSLHAIEEILPAGICETYAVMPDTATVNYMLDKVSELNRLRGISDGPKPKGSLPLTVVCLVLMAAAIAFARWGVKR